MNEITMLKDGTCDIELDIFEGTRSDVLESLKKVTTFRLFESSGAFIIEYPVNGDGKTNPDKRPAERPRVIYQIECMPRSCGVFAMIGKAFLDKTEAETYCREHENETAFYRVTPVEVS